MLTPLLLALTLLFPAGATGPAPEPAPVVASSGKLAPLLQPLTEDRIFQDAIIGMQVVNTRTGEEVFAWQADRPMQPASVTKLLTTAAALRNLGPAYRFGTDFLTDKGTELTPEGVLKGNLYVRGHGDPTLVVEKLWKMVGDLQVAGVSTIEGNIYFDASFWDDPALIPGWDKDVDIQNGPSYFAPLSALSVNFNTACLVIAPGAAQGQPARVTLETPTPVIEIDNQLTTGREGSKRWIRVDRELLEDQITVKFTLKGNIPLGTAIDREYRAVGDPMAHFISVFRGVVAERGLKVKGRYLTAPTPTDAWQLVHLDSPPLAQILADMNKHSSNFMAETVLRTLGAEVKGVPGNTTKGVAVVSEYLNAIGLPPDSYTLINGSGLSRNTTIPASTITATILDMVNDPKVGPEFLSSLAIGGVDGTLWARFRDEPGRIRGKTGSLNGVFCLAGVVEAGDGDIYAFAVLANELDASAWPVKRLLERFAASMVSLGTATPVKEPEADAPPTDADGM